MVAGGFNSPYPYEFSSVKEFKSYNQSHLIDERGRICVPCNVCKKLNRIGSKRCSTCNSLFILPKSIGWHSFSGSIHGGYCCEAGYNKVENALTIEWEFRIGNRLENNSIKKIQPLTVDDLLIMAGEKKHEIVAFSLMKGTQIWKADLYSSLESYSQMALSYPYIYLTIKDPLHDGTWYFARISVFDGELEIIADFNEQPPAWSYPLIMAVDEKATWLVFPLSNKLFILDISDDLIPPPYHIYKIQCHSLLSGDEIAGVAVGKSEIHILSKKGGYYYLPLQSPLPCLELNGCKPILPPRQNVLCSAPVYCGNEICFLETDTKTNQAAFRHIDTNRILSNPCLLDSAQDQAGGFFPVHNDQFRWQVLYNGTLPFVVNPQGCSLYLYRPNRNQVEITQTHRPWDSQLVSSIWGQQTAAAVDGEGWLVNSVTGDAAQSKSIVPFSLYSGGRLFTPLFRPFYCFLGMVIVTDGKVFIYSFQ